MFCMTDGWLSETLPEIATVKRALIQAAAHKRLLIDASKFRPAAFTRVVTPATASPTTTFRRSSIVTPLQPLTVNHYSRGHCHGKR